jgi:hypothetical protein
MRSKVKILLPYCNNEQIGSTIALHVLTYTFSFVWKVIIEILGAILYVLHRHFNNDAFFKRRMKVMLQFQKLDMLEVDTTCHHIC